MRAYTVATAAVTLRVPPKWLDNVLSHHAVAGVSRGRQGISRRLTPQAMLILGLATRLSRDLQIPLGRALELAHELAQSSGEVSPGKGMTLAFDLRALEAELTDRLAHAVEIAPVPRRGRPAKEY